MSDRPRCGRPRRDGSPCGQFVDDGAKCIWHGDGVTDEDRSRIAKVGGLTKLRTLPPETQQADVFTARGLLRRLQLIEQSVVTGALAPEVAKAAAYTLSVAKGVVELAVHAKIREVEERLEELQRLRLPGEHRRLPA